MARRHWLLGLGMGLALGLTGILLAHGHHSHQERTEKISPVPTWPQDGMALTVEQSRKFADLTRSFQARTEALWGELRRHQETLKRTWNSEELNEKQLDTSLNDLQRTRAQLHDAGRTYLEQVRVLLTTEQACRCDPSGCPCTWACGRCAECGQALSCCGGSAPCECAAHNHCRQHCRSSFPSR